MSQHVRVERVSDVLQQRAQLLATAMSTYKCRARSSRQHNGLLVSYRTLAWLFTITPSIDIQTGYSQRRAVSYCLLTVLPISRAHTQFQRPYNKNGYVRTTTLLVMRHPWLRCGDNIASMAWVPEI